MLNRTFDEHGQSRGKPDIIPFGAVITEKSRVEERIRRAQRAILNPSTGYDEFLLGPDEDPDERELSFSKNSVCLELSGPDLTDLSFCDLPGTCFFWFPIVPSLDVGFICKGLIASVGQSGNTSDIALVRDLVETYISRPSCLILLTVTCESKFCGNLLEFLPLTPYTADFENQGAHQIAKLHDPDGQRTIGL